MRLGNFLRRARDEQRLLLAALCWVASLRAALWLLPFRLLRPYIERGDARRRIADKQVAARIAWAISAAARFVPRATCVTQAVAAKMMLARRGFGSEIRYGIGCMHGQVIAHAWLESGGRVIVGERGLDHLVPLASLERRMRERRVPAQTAAAIR